MTRNITAAAVLLASTLLAPAASSVAHAADRELAFRPGEKLTVEVSWKAYMGEQFQVCIKPAGAGGDICGGKNTVHQSYVLASPDLSWDRTTSRMTVVLQMPACGKYKIRIKRSALSFETKEFYLPC